MQTITWRGYSLSRLMLGTVQFGMPYGIANRTGQPDYAAVRSMVAAAIEGGVNCFDTAAAYGTSEEVLGRVLSELDVADRVVMVTKVRALTPVELADPVSATRAIEQSVAESRRRLRIDCLPVVLFHHEADARYLNVLERLKEKGWLRHAGVSGDNRPGPAPGWIAAGTVAALQLPGNILDRRHQRTGVFRQAAERDVAIFIRSVYLQGLLVMPEDLIPPALRGIIPIRRRLTALAGDAGMSWSELALRYMLTQTGVTCILTGVDTLAQVLENIALFERGPLAADIVAAADAVVPDLPETILTPALWPRSSPP